MRLDLDGPTCGRNPIARRRPAGSGDATRTLGAVANWHATMMSSHGNRREFYRSIVLRAAPPASSPSHHVGYRRRELARRTARPHGLDTIPECQTDPHEQSTATINPWDLQGGSNDRLQPLVG